MRELAHKNICAVYDIFDSADAAGGVTVWLLMEFCKSPLRPFLKTAQRQQCYDWAAQLLDAVAFVHAKGLLGCCALVSLICMVVFRVYSSRHQVGQHLAVGGQRREAW